MVFHVIKFQTLITNGNITLENVIIKDQSFLIKKEGTLLVKLPKPRPSKLIPKKINLDIFYEDEHLLVLNKKSGNNCTSWCRKLSRHISKWPFISL